MHFNFLECLTSLHETLGFPRPSMRNTVLYEQLCGMTHPYLIVQSLRILLIMFLSLPSTLLMSLCCLSSIYSGIITRDLYNSNSCILIAYSLFWMYPVLTTWTCIWFFNISHLSIMVWIWMAVSMRRLSVGWQGRDCSLCSCVYTSSGFYSVHTSSRLLRRKLSVCVPH